MKQRTVLITGGADGIGLAIGKTFAAAGYRVALCDLQKDKLQQEVTNLNTVQQTALAVACDVTKEDEVIGAIQQTIETFGSIDIVVNNAGLQFIAPVEEFPTDKFELLLKVMLIGPFMFTKHVFPIMKKQQFGRIINMASINGLIGFAGKSAYNSAKHGLIGLTKVTALEGAQHNITVNAVCPGYVDTKLVRNQLSDLAKMRNMDIEKVLEEVIYPLVPAKRLLAPEEVARYVLFLAGEESKNITGQAVVIDGGYTVQ